MPWTLGLGAPFGIRVRLHLSFLLLLAWVVYVGFTTVSPADGEALGIGGAVLSGSVLIAIFAIVVLHEMAHALTARAFGIGVRDIILLPIGGVARLERLAPDPKQEILIAAAGPAANFVLALLAAPFLLLLHLGAPLGESESWSLVGLFCTQVYFVNLLIGTFNLIPAFPMDGGRILRALLVKKRGHLQATIVAARMGRFIAIAMIAAGILIGRFWLPFIGLFVLFAGRQEEMMTRRLAALRSLQEASPGPLGAGSKDGTPGTGNASAPPTAEETIAQLRRANELLRRDPRFHAEPEPEPGDMV